ncbi:MAG: YceI family protein [Candidatus Zixiibacteriota bacterium]|nr:MAG: YceI family protein [candidate division Zixibacteria bacterium]
MSSMLTALTVFLTVQVATVHAGEYQVDRNAENSVAFHSRAPLEDFEGITDDIDGYILWDGMDAAAATPTRVGEFYFEVNLDGLDTGIGLRNRHMRENYLETERYPFVSFKGSVTGVRQVSDSTFEIQSSGTFDLHGVSQKRSITVRTSPTAQGYHVTGEFAVKLEDHKIKVPKLMFLKIDQNIRVSVDFYLKELKGEN